MGQQFSSIQQINRLYQMPLGQYGLKERMNSAISLWKRRYPPYQQLIESRMIVNNQRELGEIYDIFKMRHMHQYLPATRYLTCQHHGIKGCGQYYQGNIYFDHAIATLSMINDIPFFDSLHLFSVALKGFQILFRKFGYFDIFQDMFHICQSGKVKVWCNSQIYKLQPEQYLLDRSGKEEDMIYRIINMIDENVDKSDKYNLKNQLYKKLRNGTHFQSFDHVNIIFRQLSKQKGWTTPQRLRCISQLSREDIQKLLFLQQKLNKQQKQFNNSTQNLLKIDSLNGISNQAYLNNNYQGKTSLRLQNSIQVQQKKRNYESSSNLQVQTLKNNKSQVINYVKPPSNNRANNFFTSPMYPPSSPTLRPITFAQKEVPQFLTVRTNTPEIRLRPRVQTPQSSKPACRILSVQKHNRHIQNKPQIFPSPPAQFHNNLILINKKPPLPHTSLNHYQVQMSPRFNPSTFANNIKKNQPIIIQNSIRIPANTPQRNIQPNIHLQQTFQQKTPVNFIHNEIIKVGNQPIISQMRNFNEIDQNFINFSRQTQKSNNILNLNNSNQPPTPIMKSIIISEPVSKNNSNSGHSNPKSIQKKQVQRQIRLNSFRPSPQNQQTTIKTSQAPKFQSIQQFQQKFQQSIMSPQQSLRSVHRQSKRYLQYFQENNIQMSSQMRKNKKRIHDNVQYTDPKLIQMLSPRKSQKQIRENETDPNIGNKNYLQKDLYYSFSQTSLNQRQKQQNKIQKLQITQQSSTHAFSNMFDRNSTNYNDFEHINSSPQVSLRDQNTKRKYQTVIDQEIWKDYMQLKKKKNMN